MTLRERIEAIIADMGEVADNLTRPTNPEWVKQRGDVVQSWRGRLRSAIMLHDIENGESAP